jgi:hypothetical protein
MLNVEYALVGPGGRAMPLDLPLSRWQLLSRTGERRRFIQSATGARGVRHEDEAPCYAGRARGAVNNAPYKAPRNTPVLYVKLRNCLVGHGDAIAVANDIPYGLSSHVCSGSSSRAHRVAAAVEAGMCFVSSQNVRELRQPFGGIKASGTGRQGGTWSYEVFREPKNVCVSRGSHPIPHWGRA